MKVADQPSCPISMGDVPWQELEKICPERVRYDVPMSLLTTLRIGGPAAAVVRPTSVEDVANVIRWTRQKGIPIFAMGWGSNLLVGDRGIRGVVIQLAPPMDRWETRDAGITIHLLAQAGFPLRRLLQEGLRRGWGGLEFLVGIPGVLGGAIAMNAGTQKESIDQLVAEIGWVNQDGELVKHGRQDLRFSYRKLELPPDCVIVEAQLRLPKRDAAEIRAALRDRMRRRRQKQPYTLPSAGSVFKNPPGDFAGRIIEETGLKGLTIGRVQVSERHANFIVNLGGGTARDFLKLTDEVRTRVLHNTGVHLELELQVIGEFS